MAREGVDAIAEEILDKSLFLLYEDGYYVYSNALLDVYQSCDSKPRDPTLEDLVKTSSKCVGKAFDAKPIITFVEKETYGKSIMIGKNEIYFMECSDVSNKVLEDPFALGEVFELFDEELWEEIEEAERVILCTLKRREMSEREREELKSFDELSFHSP